VTHADTNSHGACVCGFLLQELTWIIGRYPRDKTPTLNGSIGISGIAPDAAPKASLDAAASSMGTSTPASAKTVVTSTRAHVFCLYTLCLSVCVQFLFVSSGIWLYSRDPVLIMRSFGLQAAGLAALAVFVAWRLATPAEYCDTSA
jgi:hypothetical protein